MFFIALGAPHRKPRCPLGDTAYCSTGECPCCPKGGRRRASRAYHDLLMKLRT